MSPAGGGNDLLLLLLHNTCELDASINCINYTSKSLLLLHNDNIIVKRLQ